VQPLQSLWLPQQLDGHIPVIVHVASDGGGGGAVQCGQHAGAVSVRE
jgi:hypothetical protein